ncbi:MAG: response regulator [Myxococcales bacterium]|nr:response regulator [Myxococcota bacterium]MDW8280281.1 response regulator [Myxococcales bacterium]
MPRHVLIVDDSTSMRHLLAETCLRLGDVEVTEAADGLDALKRLATSRFDLIFIDVNMPLLDGLKLIRRVRSSPEHRHARLCVCTTEGDTEDQARQLGADYFLRKPVLRRDVERVLREVFPDAPQGVPS